MLWNVRVETSAKEALNVQNIWGKGIVNFYAPLDLYCDHHLAENDIAWFEKLNSRMNGKLCELLQPFLISFYAGDWNYSEDEYDFFAKRYPHYAAEIDEPAFKQTVREVSNKWQDVAAVISGLQALVDTLKNEVFEAIHWYEPGFTVQEFEALIVTLELLQKRGAETVRIVIE